MLNLGQLEPFGIFTLAGGLLYSIGILTVQSDKSKFRTPFIVLTLVIFIALFAITVFKYLKYRYTCERMDDLVAAMKIE
jgi:membrane protein YdbS with pleckstrin-like domain